MSPCARNIIGQAFEDVVYGITNVLRDRHRGRRL